MSARADPCCGASKAGFVMSGLVPGIHVFKLNSKKGLDGRFI
jgi:hypothetical protein